MTLSLSLSPDPKPNPKPNPKAGPKPNPNLVKAGADTRLRDGASDTALDWARREKFGESVRFLENCVAIRAQVANPTHPLTATSPHSHPTPTHECAATQLLTPNLPTPKYDPCVSPRSPHTYVRPAPAGDREGGGGSGPGGDAALHRPSPTH